MSELSTAKRFQFIGGNLALDFCNTVGGKRGLIAREYLNSPLQYIAWCQQAGILSQEQAERSLIRAADPEQAAMVSTRAIPLREAIYNIFASGIDGARPEAAHLETLNLELSKGLSRLQVSPRVGPDAFEWSWSVVNDALDQPLGPIAHAAASLLIDSHKLAHVRICHGDTCGWLFVDSSRNHSRCWCDMRDCGNRAKIRRHRLKRRGLSDMAN